MIHKIIAQTMGSQFPRVPMVKVNGLKSHTIKAQAHRFSGTLRSFKIMWMNMPTSKSAVWVWYQFHKTNKNPIITKYYYLEKLLSKLKNITLRQHKNGVSKEIPAPTNHPKKENPIKIIASGALPEAENRNFPHEGWRIELGTSRNASKGE